MLYGWIEIGASNNTLFKGENNDDIIIRTIYDNKIILGNTNGTNADAAMYIKGNNVGVFKVPDSNVSLDVNGVAVLKSAQVGLSNLPSKLTLNADLIIKDKSVSFSNTNELSLLNNNAICDINYNNVPRIQITNGNGITLNDNVYINNDVYATAFNLTSDARFKTNIQCSDIESDIDILRKLQVMDYDFILSPSTYRRTKGFIAQEVEKVFPIAVTDRRKNDVDISPIKTLDTAQITALNTSALQAILARLEKLEKYVYENK
jgi:hypothetical protein